MRGLEWEPWDASTLAVEPLLIHGQMHRTKHSKLLWFLQVSTANSSGIESSCGVLQAAYHGLEFVFGTKVSRLDSAYTKSCGPFSRPLGASTVDI